MKSNAIPSLLSFDNKLGIGCGPAKKFNAAKKVLVALTHISAGIVSKRPVYRIIVM